MPVVTYGPIFEQSPGALAAQVLAAFWRYLAYLFERTVIPRMRNLLPVRTGDLMRSLDLAERPNGFTIGFRPPGRWYAHLQPGVANELTQLVNLGLNQLAQPAANAALAEVFGG